ncbi:MAG: amino acid ABC transporter substrate-binding protein [Azospirillaceae bacterium]|nr:amino acid ABC transporter substrate-binding protein [Azospirillaceae bacterium]
MLALPLGYHAGDAVAGVVDRIRQKGTVRCAVDQTPGFSGIDGAGEPVGFDVDFCRAVAAAVLGDTGAITTQRVSTANKFKALVNDEIDIAFGMATWTFTRDTTLGVTFPAVTFFDGQGFLAWVNDGENGDAKDKICVQAGTTSESNLTDYLLHQKPPMQPFTSPTSEAKWQAFAQRRCAMVTGDRSELAARKATMAPGPNTWRMLPDTISREPLGPAIARGDEQWETIVRWVMLLPQIAEAKGVTSANIKTTSEASDIEIRRLAGLDPAFGKELTLDPGWARRIIAGVGNYAEIYDRNITPLGLERGQNALWRNDGLMFPPPLR